MKEKNNKVLIGLLIGIIVMLLAFILLFETKLISFNSKIDNKANEVIDKAEETIEKTEQVIEEKKEEKQYTSDELLSIVRGIWTHVDSNNVRYMSAIVKNGFSYGRYQTDGGIYGEIKNVNFIGNNIYELTVFSEGCHESEENFCLEEKEDATYIIKLDIGELESKKIKLNVNGNVYYTLSYIGDNWEEVERNLG